MPGRSGTAYEMAGTPIEHLLPLLPLFLANLAAAALRLLPMPLAEAEAVRAARARMRMHAERAIFFSSWREREEGFFFSWLAGGLGATHALNWRKGKGRGGGGAGAGWSFSTRGTMAAA